VEVKSVSQTDKTYYTAIKKCLTRELQTRKKMTVKISGSCLKRQRRKRQSVTAKREKSQTPKVLTAILTLPNLT